MRAISRGLKRAYYWWFYLSWTVIARAIFIVGTRKQVSGTENVPPRGPLVVASNHMSLLDPSLIATVIPRRVRFVAKAELYKNPIGAFLVSGYGSIKVNREKPGREQIERIMEALRRDAVIGVFPEGTRNSGTLMRAKPGIALMAAQAGAPIVPVAITGSDKLFRFPSVLGRPRVVVRIGEPFTLPSLEGSIGRAQLSALSDMVMQRIAAMLPPEAQGYYGLKTAAVQPPSGEPSKTAVR